LKDISELNDDDKEKQKTEMFSACLRNVTRRNAFENGIFYAFVNER